MSRAARIALAIGLGTAIVLIAVTGISSIASVLAHAGWRLMLLIPLQILPLMLDVLGWRCLIVYHVPIMPLFGIASIRQAINRLLPVANVGGDIVGIQLLSTLGPARSMAVASVIVELMLGLVAQYLFIVCGVACILTLRDDEWPTRTLILGLVLSLPIMILPLVMMRHGGVVTRSTDLASKMFGRWVKDAKLLEIGHRLEFAIQEIFGAGSRPLRSVAWQLAGYLAGCTETWLALRWLGASVSSVDALVLESLMQGVKSVFFYYPRWPRSTGGRPCGGRTLFGIVHRSGARAVACQENARDSVWRAGADCLAMR